MFTRVPPLPWLEENGFPTGEEELLLQRELQGDGRNVCRIDGKLVTVAQLRELGRQLLNIHGQHDGQQLWTRPVTWAIWTSSAGASLCWRTIRRPTASGTTSAEMDKLQMDEAERSRRVDTLNYQIQELERAQMKAGEDEELSARRTLLRSAGKLMEAVQSRGVCPVRRRGPGRGPAPSSPRRRGRSRGCPPSARSWGNCPKSSPPCGCAADDAADTLRDLSRSFDFSPGELDQVEERLDLLYRLRKKYGPTVEGHAGLPGPVPGRSWTRSSTPTTPWPDWRKI